MDAKKFKDELVELLKRHQLFPQHPGKLIITGNIAPEMKFSSVKVSPEFEVR